MLFARICTAAMKVELEVVGSAFEIIHEFIEEIIHLNDAIPSLSKISIPTATILTYIILEETQTRTTNHDQPLRHNRRNWKSLVVNIQQGREMYVHINNISLSAHRTFKLIIPSWSRVLAHHCLFPWLKPAAVLHSDTLRLMTSSFKQRMSSLLMDAPRATTRTTSESLISFFYWYKNWHVSELKNRAYPR